LHGNNQNYLEASKWYEKLYQGYRDIYGVSHIKTKSILDDFIYCLRQSAYEYGRNSYHELAIEMFNKVYNYQVILYGENDFEIVKTLSNLGYTHGQKGDMDAAVACYEKSYGLSCQLCGENHPTTLALLFNWATCCESCNDYPKAFCMWERLENGYTESNLIDQAIVCLNKQQDILKKINNPSWDQLYFILYRLADNYEQCHRYAEAKECYEKVYSYRCKTLGAEHQDTIYVYRKINNLLKKLNN